MSFYRCQRLPKHVVHLLHIKRKWAEAKRSGDYTAYKAAGATAGAAIRSHQRNIEHRIIYSNNHKAFFSYINNKLNQPKCNNDICLKINNISIVDDQDVADALCHEFSKNFSAGSDVSSCIDTIHEFSFNLYCTEFKVIEALLCCQSSNSSPDGISYKILKLFNYLIFRPINIVFQQSIYSGIFSAVWKQAPVVPLYKGHGDHCDPFSYRPVSMCSCLGKLLEKVVQLQFTEYLKVNDKLCHVQHGFTPGKSTVTNIIVFDAAIADAVAAGHAYNVISFDLKAAFDKAPHKFVLEALSDMGVSGTLLRWFYSFLSSRSQRVKVGDYLSEIREILSGVIQGSTCGPGLYTALIDSLLRRMKLPSGAPLQMTLNLWLKSLQIIGLLYRLRLTLLFLGQQFTVCLSPWKNALSYIVVLISHSMPTQLVIVL